MNSKASRKESVRQARKEMYRQLIFEAAERVFAEQGFDGAKMQDVAAEAGLSLGTLYAIFAGKAELFQAIHESRGRQLIEHARAEAGRFEDVTEQLLQGLRAYVEFLLDHPHFLRIHLDDGRVLAIGRSSQPIETEEGAGTEVDFVAESMHRAMSEGALYDDDPILMARLTIATQQVLLADHLERSDGGDREKLLDRLETYVKRTFVRPTAVAELETRASARATAATTA
jgi:AcrR family transcriptional regulator